MEIITMQVIGRGESNGDNSSTLSHHYIYAAISSDLKVKSNDEEICNDVSDNPFSHNECYPQWTRGKAPDGAKNRRWMRSRPRQARALPSSVCEADKDFPSPIFSLPSGPAEFSGDWMEHSFRSLSAAEASVSGAEAP